MASRRTTINKPHEWTEFEKYTLVCLMAKGMHLEELANHRHNPGNWRKHAYLNVATELNKALNGANGFKNDIDKKEVGKMIDKLMVERKGVVGKGGYMERATKGRITRGLKQVWNRKTAFDYNGTETEWNQWRKESEADKRRIAAGEAQVDRAVGAAKGAMESAEKEAASDIVGDIRRRARAGSNPPGSLSDSDTMRTPEALPVAQSPEANMDSQALFDRLPAELRRNERYAWANPASRQSNIDSSRISGSSSASSRFPSSQSSGRRGLLDSYRPSTSSTYAGTARPTNNSRRDTNSGQANQSEMSQRKSSEYKKPGILKRRSAAQEHRDRIPDHRISHERSTMLAEPNMEVEMGEGGEDFGSARRGALGKGVNKEDLPFNCLKRQGQGEDTKMRDGGH